MDCQFLSNKIAANLLTLAEPSNAADEVRESTMPMKSRTGVARRSKLGYRCSSKLEYRFHPKNSSKQLKKHGDLLIILQLYLFCLETLFGKADPE